MSWGAFLTQILSAALGSLGFSLLFGNRLWSRSLSASAVGALGWAVYLCLTGAGHSWFLACLAASVVVGLLAEGQAKLFKAPSTVFLIVGLIPLVPGGSLYYTLSNALLQNWEQSRFYLNQTLQFTLGLAGGVALVAGISLMLRRR